MLPMLSAPGVRLDMILTEAAVGRTIYALAGMALCRIPACRFA
jgi:hypothetical protein